MVGWFGEQSWWEARWCRCLVHAPPWTTEDIQLATRWWQLLYPYKKHCLCYTGTYYNHWKNLQNLWWRLSADLMLWKHAMIYHDLLLCLCIKLTIATWKMNIVINVSKWCFWFSRKMGLGFFILPASPYGLDPLQRKKMPVFEVNLWGNGKRTRLHFWKRKSSNCVEHTEIFFFIFETWSFRTQI